MRLCLTVILSGQAYQRIELEKFQKLRVGRGEDCEVHLDNAAVSRYHCEIIRKDDLLRLRDLGSQNGTQLNGVRVDNHSLKNGDVITIGKFTIDVQVVGGRKASKRADRAPHGKMTVEGDEESLARARHEGETRLRGYLAYEADTERTINLEKMYTLFGADAEADVPVGGWFAPRLAAVLIREEFGFRLIDLSPKGNAVRVNGTRASDVRLSSNDTLQVRRLRLRFHHGRPM